MRELLDNLLFERDIVEQLIDIDNEKMNTTFNFQNYYEAFCSLITSDDKELLIDNNSLFITEGNPLLTLNVLLRVKSTSHKVVIFINQGFIGMNKWLIEHFYRITENGNVELDTGINYNKYINLDYKVIPLGEDELIDTVMEDFYE